MADNYFNPFVGLRPYESEDSLYYFGRGEQVKTLLRQLHQHRSVAVVGSSGSGKSSLIRAGLIPQLEAGFLVQERDQWLVARMKPGEEPIGNLVGSLLAALNSPPFSFLDVPNSYSPPLKKKGAGETLSSAIREQGAQAILDLLTPQLANSDTNLFILVDQFEELFRFGLEHGKAEQRQEAEEFVALLLALARQESLPIYVCLTMRSDFLGDCDAFYGLPEAINQSQFLVPRLTRSQRQDVITHPVHLVGARIAPRLVDRLLNEGIDTRDDLPVLQHVLMRTWDAWQAAGSVGALDIAHYEQVHTIHHALDSHANEVLGELDERQQDIAKKLFQALTAVDAGNRRIRRQVYLDEVCVLTGALSTEVMEVINVFRGQGRSFLVLSSVSPDDNSLIDISHESLIRQWGKLNEWVDEEMELAKIYRRLEETSQLYDLGKTVLYQNVDLQQALYWRENIPKGDAGEIWSKRYKLNFRKAIAFLENSQLAFDEYVSVIEKGLISQRRSEYESDGIFNKIIKYWKSALIPSLMIIFIFIFYKFISNQGGLILGAAFIISVFVVAGYLVGHGNGYLAGEYIGQRKGAIKGVKYLLFYQIKNMKITDKSYEKKVYGYRTALKELEMLSQRNAKK